MLHYRVAFQTFDVQIALVEEPAFRYDDRVDWHKKLKLYQAQRPGLRIVDSFEAVMQLTNRISMLDPVRDGFLLKASIQSAP